MGDIADWLMDNEVTLFEDGSDFDMPRPSCIYCGDEDVQWSHAEDGRWILVNSFTGDFHECDFSALLEANK